MFCLLSHVDTIVRRTDKTPGGCLHPPCLSPRVQARPDCLSATDAPAPTPAAE